MRSPLRTRRVEGDGRGRSGVYVFRARLSEVQNANVHAFSVKVLILRNGYRYTGRSTCGVGAITCWYMRAIDPFRHWIVYPAILRALRRGWDALPA